MTWLKNKAVAGLTLAAAVLGGLAVTFSDRIVEYIADETLEEREYREQAEAYDSFMESSSVVDAKVVDGKIYLRYKTCNIPPKPLGDYRYRVYINGVPSPELPDDGSWYNANDWQKPIYCTEGWWGNRGWVIPDHAGPPFEIRVIWEWRMRINDRDAPTYHTVMEYLIGDTYK